MKYYVGVDLGGTNIVAGVVDDKFNIIHKDRIKTQSRLAFSTIVKNMADLIEKVINDSGIQREKISSVGVGTPSCMNPKTELIVHANSMGWKNVPLYSELKKYIDFPLYIKNDADCAALGESLAGAAKNYNSALMITLGTGVGGGIIINKKIFNGCDGMGAEFGHTKLVYHGESCTCGQRGCFEAYASATALINQTKTAALNNPNTLINELCGGDINEIDGRTAFTAAKLGDKLGQKVVDNYISYLAAGLSSVICVFRPDVIIIGGGIGGEGDYLLNPLNEKIMECTYAVDIIGAPKAIKAVLGNDAGVIGAAMLEIG